MTRLPRGALPDGVFHVTARGVRRSRLFVNDDDYALFVHLLRHIGASAMWRLHAYCLMPNHYHAVIESSTPRLSSGMHRLNGRYAQDFNSRHDLVGHVFEGRYRSRVIGEEEYLAAACRYVRDNPLRAGLCQRAEDWPWSG